MTRATLCLSCRSADEDIGLQNGVVFSLNKGSIAGNLAPVKDPEPNDRLRELARGLHKLAEGADQQTTRADLDFVIDNLRIFAVRNFGRRPRSVSGEGGGPKILSYMQNHIGEWLDGEELAVVSGIQEWARRVRELRLQQGYDIVEDGGKYLLKDVEPDQHLAARWQTLNNIRKSGGSGKDRIMKLLRMYVGEVVTRDDIDYVASPVKEGSRRARELRDELGWPFESNVEDPSLRPGEYRLVSAAEEDLLDPRQRLYPEKLRARIFARDNFQCGSCSRNRELAERSGDRRFFLEVHHLIAVAEQLDGLPAEQLNDEGNLVTLCHACHRLETAKLQKRRRQQRRRI